MIHVFQKAGLGLAPFHCVGFASIPSPSLAEQNPTAYNNALALLPRGIGCGSCQYCGTAIMHNFIIESSDGHRFVVGSDCVAKTGDAGLIREVKVRRVRAKQEKREAARKLARADREALWAAERAIRAEEFKVQHAALIEAAKPWRIEGTFVHDVLTRFEAGGFVSDRALAAVTKAVADLNEAERLRKASKHVGAVGERLKGLKVKVTRVTWFGRPAFNAPWREETVWVATMRTADDNVLVSMGSFRPEEGAELTIAATVKEHTEYKGMSQTRVIRVKEEKSRVEA